MENCFQFVGERIYAHYSHDERPQKESFSLHTHRRCEICCFLRGKGSFKVEGTSYIPRPGDILIMRPGEAHYIDVDSGEPYTRLVVHFDTDLFEGIDPKGEFLAPFFNRDNGKWNLYTATDFETRNYRTYLQGLSQDAPDRAMQITANLLPLLNELRTAFARMEKKTEAQSPIQRILAYINGHLTDPLSLDGICNEFYISKPQLCRVFRQATGSTVWEYVTAKRLIAANRLIRAGHPPTEAFAECGFGDYSSFYRAYKKRFGVSPAADK